MKFTNEQKKVLERVAYLEKSASVITDMAQSLRIKYQDEHDLSCTEFYLLLGDYLKETTGKGYL